ncbi:MAG: Zn-ribbon domain-containing OB-fold protein [Crenarchaeota archaeon]|nr:Zn-ribbon domain-containing OB-fold protein [Thermoproteota archaeon]
MEVSPSVVWRNKPYRYRLEVRRCPKCGRAFREEVEVCPKCNERTERVRMAGRGKLLSWAKVCQVPEGFEDFSPLYFGLVELEDGSRIIARLTDVLEEPKIGMEMEAVLRKVRADGSTGLIEYAIFFRPAF